MYLHKIVQKLTNSVSTVQNWNKFTIFIIHNFVLPLTILSYQIYEYTLFSQIFP